MGLRKNFFFAVVRVLLTVGSASSTLSVPGVVEVANGLIPKVEKPSISHVSKPNGVNVRESPAKNLSPTGIRIVEEYMDQSRAILFGEVGEKISKSAARGAVVHLEDGETDDFWHDGLACRDGLFPSLILLRGGPWMPRKKITQKVWEAYQKKYFPAGQEMPEILTIHGDKRGDWGTWDEITGKGIFSDKELKEMQDTSNLLEADPNYLAEVERAEKAFLKVANDEGPTTIVVKTAPTGLAKLIRKVKDYQKKIVVVWGAAVAVGEDGGFSPRFNYRRDLLAGDELLSLGIPIICISPAISRTDMIAVIDKAHHQVWNQYSRWPLRHPGFDQLKNFATTQNEITKLLDGPVVEFMKLKIAKSVTEYEKFEKAEDEHLKAIEAATKEKGELSKQIEEIQSDDAEQHDKLAQVRDQLETVSANLDALNVKLRTTRTAKKQHIARGMQWKKIMEQDVLDGSYRDVCAVDLFNHIPMVKELREKSITGVMRVGLKRQPDQDELLVTSFAGSGYVFVCTDVDSKPLSAKVQEFIYSVVADERKEVPTLEEKKAAEIHAEGVERALKEKLLTQAATLETEKAAELDAVGVENTVHKEQLKRAADSQAREERNTVKKTLKFTR